MSRRRQLGKVALALGAAAPLVGSPYQGDHARIDVAELARIVERREDHISAVELAEWIRKGKPGLRVFDVRPQAEYDELHVPTAQRVSLDSLGTVPVVPGETIVLYSTAGAHAAQGWVFLRALGHQNVVFLAGGMYEWMDQVMSPTLAIDATDRERAAFTRVAELSRYFGGLPRTGVPRGEQALTAGQLRRRSC
jgi:rhodanese-related sulfurtransferase